MSTSQTVPFPQIEERPLSRRQKRMIAAAVVANILDFFDFFLIGFIMSMVAGPWELTFGQVGFVLLTGGLASVVGAAAFGGIADRCGRRTSFIVTVLLVAIGTVACAAVPEGGWLALGLMRLVVGFGIGGLTVVDVPLVQEFLPARRRGLLGALVMVFVPLGVIAGSLSAALLGDSLGWRGLLLLGIAPAFMAVILRRVVPESPRWLLARGRVDEARRSVAWALELPLEQVVVRPTGQLARRPRYRELLRSPRVLLFACLAGFGAQCAIYGATLWGPSLVAMQLEVTPRTAAYLFIIVLFSGFVGRCLFASLSDRLGRRTCGAIAALTASICLVVTGQLHDVELGGVSLFIVALAITFFFADGVFAVVSPYFSELFPTAIRSTGLGFVTAVGNCGRIVGPAGLGLISGAGTLITPQATAAAIEPAYIYLGAFALLSGLSYVLFGIETRRRTLEDIERVTASDAIAMAGQSTVASPAAVRVEA